MCTRASGFCCLLLVLFALPNLHAQDQSDPMESILESALREKVSVPADVQPSAGRFTPPPGMSTADTSLLADEAALPEATASSVGTATAESSLRKVDFSNACQPAQPGATLQVPKTLFALKEQLGSGFRVMQRGFFLIGSDLPEEEFSLLVDGVLTCCHECLAQQYFTKTELRHTVTIYVFKNEASYTYNLARLLGMQPISPYGHYGHRQQYIVINYDTGPGTLVHELTHALMAPDFPQAPIWISEGMASLYEQCRVDGSMLRGDPNWRLPELKTALDSQLVPSLSSLLALQPGEFRAKQESLNYAASRYFCKFLEERGKLEAVYAKFRAGYSADPTGIKFVEEALGQNLTTIETEWHAWLRLQTWQ